MSDGEKRESFNKCFFSDEFMLSARFGEMFPIQSSGREMLIDTDGDEWECVEIEERGSWYQRGLNVIYQGVK